MHPSPNRTTPSPQSSSDHTSSSPCTSSSAVYAPALVGLGCNFAPLLSRAPDVPIARAGMCEVPVGGSEARPGTRAVVLATATSTCVRVEAAVPRAGTDVPPSRHPGRATPSTNRCADCTTHVRPGIACVQLWTSCCCPGPKSDPLRSTYSRHVIRANSDASVAAFVRAKLLWWRCSTVSDGARSQPSLPTASTSSSGVTASTVKAHSLALTAVSVGVAAINAPSAAQPATPSGVPPTWSDVRRGHPLSASAVSSRTASAPVIPEYETSRVCSTANVSTLARALVSVGATCSGGQSTACAPAQPRRIRHKSFCAPPPGAGWYIPVLPRPPWVL
eukprot:m.983811 g.983811  ORF g.983811 m.983811 type:complete len:333 (+) comp23975_c0_seq8:190-1188(+)